jgi:hypothetical protein
MIPLQARKSAVKLINGATMSTIIAQNFCEAIISKGTSEQWKGVLP